MNRLPRRQASNSRSIGTFLAGATTGEDGTTYKETTFRVRRSTWATTGTTTLVRPLQPKSKEDGAQSLGFYARKFINSRAWDLDRTVLHHIPWKFGKMLWDDAVATGRDSFLLWSAFCTVYPTHLHELERCRAYRLHSSESISSIVVNITDTGKFRGIVDLDLSEAHDLSDADLLNLSTIPGLRNLQVCGATDSIVRSWARVRDRKGMSRLSTLSLLMCPNVTIRTLEYATWFPKLQQLELMGCQVGMEMYREARKHGWSATPRSERTEDDARELTEPLLMVSFVPDLDSMYRGKRLEKYTFYRTPGSSTGRVQEVDERRETKRASDGVQKPGATVRRNRIKDVGDLLSKLSGPPRRRR